MPLVVRAGDSITVALNEQSDRSWQVTLTNTTTGQQFQVGVPYSFSHSSAEWIEEASSADRGGILPIDTFGTVSFSGAVATLNGQQVPLAQTDPQAINLETGAANRSWSQL